MELIPTIEIKNGRSTLRTQPKPNQTLLLIDDPLKIAQRWKEVGATQLHVVDVDGNRVGMPQNWDTIRDIVRRIGLPVQLSTGVRNPEVINRVFSIGTERIVLRAGIAPERLIQDSINLFMRKVVVQIESINELVEVITMDGIRRPIPVSTYAQTIKLLGARQILYRPVTNAGTTDTVKVETVAQITNILASPVYVWAEWSSMDELEAVRNSGIAGALLSKILYDGKISFEEAKLALAAPVSSPKPRGPYRADIKPVPYVRPNLPPLPSPPRPNKPPDSNSKSFHAIDLLLKVRVN